MRRAALVLAVVSVSHAPATNDGDLISRSLPRVEYRGGLYLRHPRVVTVTFAADDAALVARLRAFSQTIVRSAWWRTVTEGYCASPTDCIGDGRSAAPVQLDHQWPAAVRDTEVADLLAREVRSGRFDPLDRDTLLLVYLPEGVTLSDAFTPRYCAGGPRAFHRMLRLNRTNVPFSVIPRCGGEAELTATASHEILEAVTNPDPARRGFAFQQTSANLGFTAAGLEPVDPCGTISMDRHRTADSGFVLQRAWSNRSASQGRNPCVPSPADQPYVALVPRTPTVRLDTPGDRVTIVLDAATDRPVPSWSVSAVDLSGQHDRERYVDVSLDRSHVEAGDTVRLTITARNTPPRQVGLVGLISTLSDTSHVWPVAVVMR